MEYFLDVEIFGFLHTILRNILKNRPIFLTAIYCQFLEYWMCQGIRDLYKSILFSKRRGIDLGYHKANQDDVQIHDQGLRDGRYT